MLTLLAPFYFLVLAGFLLFVNLMAASAPGKWLSYVGMWAAVVASVVALAVLL